MGIETGKELEEFEKRLLGNSVRELFFQMNRETDKRFSEIKEKFFKAQVNNQEELFIETLLADKNESYKFDDAFYPMVRDEYGVLGLEEEGIYLEDIYLDLPYNKLKDIEEDVFEGWININNEVYSLKVIFEKDKRYVEKIGKLYHTFEFNGQKWNTINMSHIKRMYRLKVKEYDFDMTYEIYNEIKRNRDKVEYNFEHYEKNVIRGKRLLWNVEEKQIMGNIFVRPTMRDISFEYVLRFKEDEKILVENSDKNDILCCHMENKNELNIISRRNDESIWNVSSIKSVKKCRKVMEMNMGTENILPYSHFSNYRKMTFTDRIRKKYSNEGNIRSKAALEKKFSEYDFIKDNIILKNLSINKRKEENIELYDCNEFMENDFNTFWKREKIRLNLFVECPERDNYTEDRLSFIISDIQKDMPEYDCRGYVYE